MTTFRSKNIGMSNTLHVKNSNGGAHVTLTNNDGHLHGCDVAAAEAPALALAILEAAGYEPIDSRASVAYVDSAAVERAAWLIKKHIEKRDEAAKEAADREALDAEAFELYKALNPLADARALGDLTPDGKSRYRRLALKARELHGGTQ